MECGKCRCRADPGDTPPPDGADVDRAEGLLDAVLRGERLEDGEPPSASAHDTERAENTVKELARFGVRDPRRSE